MSTFDYSYLCILDPECNNHGVDWSVSSHTARCRDLNINAKNARESEERARRIALLTAEGQGHFKKTSLGFRDKP